MLSLVLAAVIQTVVAPEVAPPFAAPPPITMTGTRLQDYAVSLDARVAAHCPPRADTVASIPNAEALFRRGDYRVVREVLAKSTARNAHAGAVEPVALSPLYLAQANVAAH